MGAAAHSPVLRPKLCCCATCDKKNVTILCAPPSKRTASLRKLSHLPADLAQNLLPPFTSAPTGCAGVAVSCPFGLPALRKVSCLVRQVLAPGRFSEPGRQAPRRYNFCNATFHTPLPWPTVIARPRQPLHPSLQRHQRHHCHPHRVPSALHRPHCRRSLRSLRSRRWHHLPMCPPLFLARVQRQPQP